MNKAVQKLIKLSRKKRSQKIKVFLFHFEKISDEKFEIWDGSYTGWLLKADKESLILIDWQKNVLVYYEIPIEEVIRFIILKK